jgi:hypothetical protein
MNTMSTPQFLITEHFKSSSSGQSGDINLEDLRKKLFEKGVLSKDYIDSGLMLLYHKYDSPVTTELERESRSLVIDRNTFKIKAYSCETPRLNKEGMEYLVQTQSSHQIINPCYEGSLLSVFNHNSKWYVSTRRCLNSQESIFTHSEQTQQTQPSHYTLFENVLKQAGYADFEEFSTKLSPLNSYYFVLIHHQNKHIIDYTKQFGENYGRVCLVTVRDSEMRELDLYVDQVDFASYDDGLIFVPKKLESIDEFASVNKCAKYTETPESEGVVVRVWDDKMHKYHLVKLQNVNYQFGLVLGADRNMFKGLLYLYQNGKLIEYFQNSNTQHIKKIVNPLNASESYDTIGMVDAVFKVCTSELLELFKLLWSLKTGKHQNKELYDILPKEYKDVMFAIKGLYYKKKAQLYSGQNNVPHNWTPEQIKNTHLKINDIYNYLKLLPTETLVAFLRMRKLMFNWVKNSPTNSVLSNFRFVSGHCDNVHVKLCAIFTSKLHPTITPNDVPPQKESHEVVIVV